MPTLQYVEKVFDKFIFVWNDKNASNSSVTYGNILKVCINTSVHNFSLSSVSPISTNSKPFCVENKVLKWYFDLKKRKYLKALCACFLWTVPFFGLLLKSP